LRRRPSVDFRGGRRIQGNGGRRPRQARKRRVSVSIQSYALAPLILANSDCLCTLPRRFLRRFEGALDLFAPPLDLGKFHLQVLWHPRMQDDVPHRWLREQVFAAVAA
jgi:hypothetical protein